MEGVGRGNQLSENQAMAANITIFQAGGLGNRDTGSIDDPKREPHVVWLSPNHNHHHCGVRKLCVVIHSRGARLAESTSLLP